MILFITIRINAIIDRIGNNTLELTIQGHVACCLFHGDHHPPYPVANRLMATQWQSIQRGMHNEHENDKAA